MGLAQAILDMHPAAKLLFIEMGLPTYPFLIASAGPKLRGLIGAKFGRVGRFLMRIPPPDKAKEMTPEEEKLSTTNVACPSCGDEHAAVCRNCTPFVRDGNLRRLYLARMRDAGALRHSITTQARFLNSEALAAALDVPITTLDGRHVKITLTDPNSPPPPPPTREAVAAEPPTPTDEPPALQAVVVGGGNGRASHAGAPPQATHGGVPDQTARHAPSRGAQRPEKREGVPTDLARLPVVDPPREPSPDDPVVESYGTREGGG